MSVRYAHRHHGHFVCGGVAVPAPHVVDLFETAFTIITPPQWDARGEDADFYAAWTLDLYVGDRRVCVGEVECLSDAVVGYVPVPIEDPREPSFVARAYDANYQAFELSGDIPDGWRLGVFINIANNLMILDITLHGTHGDLECTPATVEAMLPYLEKKPTPWQKVRLWMKARSLVLYWEELTAYQMEMGGTAYLRDLAQATRLFAP